MRYDKPALSIDGQVERLRERGMAFCNEQRVKHYLTHIGYYRLSAYWLPFEQQASAGQTRNHLFRPGTSFEAVLSLYIFDRKLRLLVMEALERIEVSVRTHWAHALAMNHGPHAHLQSQLFDSPWQHTPGTLQKWLAIWKAVGKRSSSTIANTMTTPFSRQSGPLLKHSVLGSFPAGSRPRRTSGPKWM